MAGLNEITAHTNLRLMEKHMSTEKKPAILNLSIQLENFWAEYEDGGLLADTLRNAIVAEVISAIRQQVQASINTLIADEFGEKLQETIRPMILGKLEALIQTETITVRGVETKLSEHVKALFHNSSSWNNFGATVQKLALQWGDDLKKRYDMVFANQLVMKLNENGLLLPDVAKRLMDNPATATSVK